MTSPPDPHYRHRFPAEIISHAVWLYHVFSLSLRDVELILAERGIAVSYETVRRWCQKFAAGFADRLRRRRPRPGDKWHMDEVFIRIQGVQHYLWRAVDQDGGVLDILVQAGGMPRQRSASDSPQLSRDPVSRLRRLVPGNERRKRSTTGTARRSSPSRPPRQINVTMPLHRLMMSFDIAQNNINGWDDQDRQQR